MLKKKLLTMRSLKPLVVSLSIILSGCQTMEVADFRAYVRLPASGDCFGVNVLSGKEVRIAKPRCERLMLRSIMLDSENYKLLKNSILRNCQFEQCQQIIGQFDGLFLSLDKALQKIPGP